MKRNTLLLPILLLLTLLAQGCRKEPIGPDDLAEAMIAFALETPGTTADNGIQELYIVVARSSDGRVVYKGDPWQAVTHYGSAFAAKGYTEQSNPVELDEAGLYDFYFFANFHNTDVSNAAAWNRITGSGNVSGYFPQEEIPFPATFDPATQQIPMTAVYRNVTVTGGSLLSPEKVFSAEKPAVLVRNFAKLDVKVVRDVTTAGADHPVITGLSLVNLSDGYVPLLSGKSSTEEGLEATGTRTLSAGGSDLTGYDTDGEMKSYTAYIPERLRLKSETAAPKTLLRIKYKPAATATETTKDVELDLQTTADLTEMVQQTGLADNAAAAALLDKFDLRSVLRSVHYTVEITIADTPDHYGTPIIKLTVSPWTLSEEEVRDKYYIASKETVTLNYLDGETDIVRVLGWEAGDPGITATITPEEASTWLSTVVVPTTYDYDAFMDAFTAYVANYGQQAALQYLFWVTDEAQKKYIAEGHTEADWAALGTEGQQNLYMEFMYEHPAEGLVLPPATGGSSDVTLTALSKNLGQTAREATVTFSIPGYAHDIPVLVRQLPMQELVARKYVSYIGTGGSTDFAVNYNGYDWSADIVESYTTAATNIPWIQLQKVSNTTLRITALSTNDVDLMRYAIVKVWDGSDLASYIWVEQGNYKPITVNGLTILDRNLGAVRTVTVPEAWTEKAPIQDIERTPLNGFYYQWGRTPDGYQWLGFDLNTGSFLSNLPASQRSTVPVKVADYPGVYMPRKWGETQLGKQDPGYGKWITGNSWINWGAAVPPETTAEHFERLWGTPKKAGIDPCPEGYILPAIADYERFWSAGVSDPGTFSSPAKGWFRKSDDGVTYLFFPFSPYRDASGSAVDWQKNPYTTINTTTGEMKSLKYAVRDSEGGLGKYVYPIFNTSTGVVTVGRETITGTNYGWGFSVRCVKEN